MSATSTSVSPVLRFPRPEMTIAVVAALAMVVLVAAKSGGASLSTGELIVIGLRLAVPFLIFRYWLAGGIVAMLLDAADVIVIDLLSLGGFRDHYGEPALLPPAASIHAGIYDAIGVYVNRQPMTPPRILNALKS